MKCLHVKEMVFFVFSHAFDAMAHVNGVFNAIPLCQVHPYDQYHISIRALDKTVKFNDTSFERGLPKDFFNRTRLMYVSFCIDCIRLSRAENMIYFPHW